MIDHWRGRVVARARPGAATHENPATHESSALAGRASRSAGRRSGRRPATRITARLGAFVPALTIVAVQQVLFPSRGSDGEMLWGLVLQGFTLGLLTSLVALGMALVYRANRIINFAQGDLGLVPAALAIDLVVFSGLDYVLALAVGLVVAPVVGAVVELAVVRRFFRSPRLI